MPRKLAMAAALLGALAPLGCRYRAGGALPPEVRTVAVPLLRNQTRWPGLEAEVTGAAIAEFQAHGRLQVVALEAGPDLVLEGRIESCSRRSLRTDRYGDPVRFAVTVEAVVSVRRSDGSRWLEKVRIANTAVSSLSGSVDLTRGESEAAGRAEAVRDLGRAIVRRTVEGGW